MTRAVARALGLSNAVLGAGAVVMPRRAGRLVAGRRVPSAAVVRILGARQLVQGVVTLAAPDPDVLVAGAAVDTLHALSMVPFVFGAQRRRAATISIAMALVSAGAAAAAASGSD